MRSFVVFSVLLLAGLLVPRFPSAVAATPVALPPAPPRWAAQRIMQLTQSGPGQIVVALGNPATARHVAIVVPGVGNDLATFDDPRHSDQRPYGMALALHANAPDTAVIAWLGYQPPAGLDMAAITGDDARRGAGQLRAFVRRVSANTVPGADVTLICHSYGSVVCGLAAPGLPVDNLVFLGSPGVRATSVAGLHTTAKVYAATATTDWIRWVPHLRIGDYGHGPDPTSASFGAHSLPTLGVSGHDGYFAPDSMTLLAISKLISRSSHATTSDTKSAAHTS